MWLPALASGMLLVAATFLLLRVAQPTDGMTGAYVTSSWSAGGLAVERLPPQAPMLWVSALNQLVVGLVLLAFAAIEVVPRLRDLTFPVDVMPLGGLLSGFFGGLSGMQGALRSAFLSRAGLSKEAFIGSGVVIATLIDVTRLGVYATSLRAERADLDYGLLTAAVLAAFAGALLGNRYLKSMSMPGIQRIVAAMLFAVALGLMAGVL